MHAFKIKRQKQMFRVLLPA